jgi:radical SAM superfamily enzyme YgiQ (UPF0313 family)
MKVLLVQPKNRSYVIMPNLGLGYLAAILRQSGHEVAILNCLLEKLSAKDFKERIPAISPDVIGFQLFSYDLNIVKEYLVAARETIPNVTLVAGGPHPSGDPEGTLSYLPELDYVFKGEAEIGFPLLLRRLAGDDLPVAAIPGLAYYVDSGKIRTNPPAFVQNLDTLPMPAWDLLQPETYPEAPHGAFTRSFPTAPIITSRGCPCHCTFCAGQTINSRQMRMRSLESVMNELTLLHGRGIREFHIEDENFTINKERTLKFCRLLEQQNLGMSWSLPSGVRIDSLDAEMLDAMEAAGCYSMALGIEFGSDRVMTLTCKELDTATVEARLGLFKGRKIKTTGFFLFGIPGESIREIEATIDFSLRLPLDRAQFNNFIPMPGSTLWDKLKKDGKLDEVSWDRFFVHDVAYSRGGIASGCLKRLQRKAYISFYLRPRIIRGLISEIRSWRHLLFLIKRFRDSVG